MAKPPPIDPNHPRTTDPYAAGRPVETEKKSKVLPIVIGVIVLAILAYFLLGMFSGDEVDTTEPAAEAQMDDAATDPVTPATDTATTPAPVTETPATDPTPAVEAEADAAATGATEDSITVEIGEPDAIDTPLEGAETTTVPLQSPDTAPAN